MDQMNEIKVTLWWKWATTNAECGDLSDIPLSAGYRWECESRNPTPPTYGTDGSSRRQHGRRQMLSSSLGSSASLDGDTCRRHFGLAVLNLSQHLAKYATRPFNWKDPEVTWLILLKLKSEISNYNKNKIKFKK